MFLWRQMIQKLLKRLKKSKIKKVKFIFRYKNYEVYFIKGIAETAQLSNRYSDASLYGVSYILYVNFFYIFQFYFKN